MSICYRFALKSQILDAVNFTVVMETPGTLHPCAGLTGFQLRQVSYPGTGQ